LHSHFLNASLARSIELKRKFNNLRKLAKQPIENFLHEIRSFADSLARIGDPLTEQELVELTIFGLDDDYDMFVTTVTYFRSQVSFDELQAKLPIFEQRLN